MPATSGQVSVATTGQTLIRPAKSARSGLEISNSDATNTVYLGGPTVTIASGFPLPPRQTIPWFGSAAVYGQAAGGAVVVGYEEAS